MTLAIVHPVMAVPAAPDLLRISLILLIVGIGGKLLLLPQPFACALTSFVAAVSLVFDARIAVEGGATMRTTKWLSHGFLP
jgi:hypothetical protein